jgi:hypothetical protein
MPGFSGCKWCGGRGCIACEAEQKKYEARRAQPIFTARVGNEQDMTLMRQFLGREAIEKAFGPNGGGIREVETNAAVASIIQFLNDARTIEDAAPRGATQEGEG